MGKQAIKIASSHGIDVPELIKVLQSAYCDEWLAYYQYYTGAQMAVGLMRPDIVHKFKEHAKEEHEHMEELTARIIELGGVIPLNPNDWLKLSKTGFDEPKKPFNSITLLKENLLSERKAAQRYSDILDIVSGKDKVTAALIRDTMGDEERHEQDLEDLWNDFQALEIN
jgi:bacterioferritin